ncbi:MAG: hypothetical protein ACLSHC_01745 [Bilophila wadsworthia]
MSAGADPCWRTTATAKNATMTPTRPAAKPDRPNRAVIVYAGLIRKAFPACPCSRDIEVSLRRITHYDFGPTACAVPSCSTPGWTSFP